MATSIIRPSLEPGRRARRSLGGSVIHRQWTPRRLPGAVQAFDRDWADLSALTLATSVITAATRGGGVEGDGRGADERALGIYPERVNLVSNGGFENGTTSGWSTSNGTLTATSARKQFGTYAGRFTASAASAVAFNTTPSAPAQGDRFASLVWVYADTPVVGRRAQVQLRATGGATAQTIFTSSGVVLVAGWNPIACVGQVIEADRTGMHVYVIFPDAINGDVFDIDGGTLVAGATPSPSYVRAATVESGSPLISFDFEAGVTGWTGTGAVITPTQNTSEFHDGAASMQVVAANGTGIRTSSLASFVGGEVYIYQLWSRIAAGGPASAVVRQEIMLSTGAVVLSQDVTITNDHWTYMELLYAPSVTTSHYVALRNLSGASLTYLLDRVRVDEQPTDPRVKAAGRIQAAVEDITETEGAVLLRVTPDRPSGQSAAAAVTLWDWRDDADNRISVAEEDGAIRLQRVAAGDADEVVLPLYHTRGQPLSLVAEWSADALAVTVAGADDAPELTDTFARADSTDLGTTETGQAWVNTGTKPLRIESGRLVHDTGGAGYASTVLSARPRRFGGVASFVNPGTAGAVLTLISSLDASLTFQTMVHVVIGHATWFIQSTATNVAGLASLAQGQCAIPVDGSPHEVWVTFNGDTCTLEIDTQVVATVTNPLISARSGPLVAWELLNTSGQADPRWDAVYAMPPGNSVQTATAASTHIPTLAATSVDIGSDGSSGHLGGLVRWIGSAAGPLRAGDRQKALRFLARK